MLRSNYFLNKTAEDRRLINLFSDELNRINLLYLNAIKSNDITKANTLIRKMRAIENTLYSEYGDRADIRIRKEYLLGSSYIDDLLLWGTSYIAIKKANKKQLINMVKDMGTVHVDAVNALLDNSKNYVKSSLDGMERQALTMLNSLQQEQVREQLARGIISGDGLGSIKDRVKYYFEQNSITWFKDRSGKIWELDRYVDMLTRTETSIANVQGTINRAIQVWITKFRVVEQHNCCDICAEYNGKVFDIKDGSVELPPYHPNCRGYIIPVTVTGADIK